MTKDELIAQLKIIYKETHINESAFPDGYEYVTVNNDWLVTYYAKHRKVPDWQLVNNWCEAHDCDPCIVHLIGSMDISMAFGFETTEDALLFKLMFINA